MILDFPEKTPRQRLAPLLFQVSIRASAKKEMKN